MIWQSNHRGVDFNIAPTDGGGWKWSFFTGHGPKHAIGGETKGMRDDAILDCRRAIDAYLATRPPEDTAISAFRMSFVW